MKKDNRRLIIEQRGNTWLILIKNGHEERLIHQTPCGASEDEAKKTAECLKIDFGIKGGIELRNKAPKTAQDGQTQSFRG